MSSVMRRFGAVPRTLTEAGAVERHHGARHADQGARPRHVLEARQRWLRAERGRVRQSAVGELEQGIVAQAVGIVAVLAAGSDHQKAEAQHLGEAVLDALRRARIIDASGQTPGDAKPLLDLTQRQQAAIRGEGAAVEAGDDRLAGDW